MVNSSVSHVDLPMLEPVYISASLFLSSSFSHKDRSLSLVHCNQLIHSKALQRIKTNKTSIPLTMGRGREIALIEEFLDDIDDEKFSGWSDREYTIVKDFNLGFRLDHQGVCSILPISIQSIAD